MMREIIFRGKSTVNGDWVEGELLHDMKDRPRIYWTTPKELPVYFSNNVIVIPETVGQFTGLTDKNGVKIFEGDILQARIDESYPENITTVVIKWVDGAFYYCQGDFEPDLIDDSVKDFEVIGNIHDNPELLEVE